MMPAVSILVTVYNRERYLADCLDSILASTFANFEIIVVDDASSDGSVEIGESYAARDPRIRFFRNPTNLGDYGNRNRAASLAKGDYLKYLDADDLIYPHSLAMMVEAMEQFPEAALALSLNDPDPPKPFPFETSPQDVSRAQFLGRGLLGAGPSASILRRSAFEAVGGFTGRQFVGDIELWQKLARRWPLVSLPPALVWWRQHEGQQIHLEMSRPEVIDVRYQLSRETIESDPWLSPEEKSLAGRRVRQHHARRLLSLGLRQRRPAVAWRLFRMSGLSTAELIGGLRGYEE